MREHLPKIVILVLLAVVVGLPFVIRPLAAQPPVAEGAVDETLIIISPHNEQIRYETSQAFNAWRMEQGMPAVGFDWRSSGGTSDLRKQVLAQLSARANDNAADQGVGADLFFGGGEYDHNKLAGGITHTRSWNGRVAEGTVSLDLPTPMHAVTTLKITGLPDSGTLAGQVIVAGEPVPFQAGETVSQIVGRGAMGVAEITTKFEAAADSDGPTLTVTLRNATGRPYTLDALRLPNGMPDRVSIDLVQKIPATVPIALGPGILEAAFPAAEIGGESLYHDDLYWVGVVLSSFGIVYNRDVLATLGVPEPETWADLTNPRLMGWVALADPSHSGSIAATYDTILRRLGWADGWRLLREAFANARYFAAGASKVPVDVSAGEAAVGMCIDFYGRFQAGAIGGNRVGYVDPAYMTATTADPISLMRGAPHDELALQFIEWLLSKPAQELWQGRLGTPDGPEAFELRRQPIRQDMYTAERRSYWADPDIAPFDTARPMPEAIPSFFGFIAPLSHAMAIDQHETLQAAWQAIQATPPGPKRQAMLELFHAMPPELTITWPAELAENWREALMNESHPEHAAAAAVIAAFADDISQYSRGDAALQARLDWLRFFRANYKKIIAMADE